MRKKALLALVLTAFCYFSFSQPLFLKRPGPVEKNRVRISPANVFSLPRLTGNKEKERALTRVNFEDHIQNIYNSVDLASYNLDYDVFRLGMVGYYFLEGEGALNEKGLLTIIDFARPSTEKRFYTIDVENRELKFHTYVSHGQKTGQNLATAFSNIPHSNQSSLGFYVTGETYVGSKGYSLRLDGMEKSFNDNIRRRAVVIHAANYVTEDWIKRYGRLGRSQGCPALPPDLSREVIDTIKDKSAIFTYYPDEIYLNTSGYLKVEDLFDKLDEKPAQIAVVKPPAQS